jgi:hypothetical protein
MASNRPLHGDISSDGVFGDYAFGPDWHRLFSAEGLPSLGLAGLVAPAPAALATDGSGEQIFPAHVAAQAVSAGAESSGLDPSYILATDELLGVSQTSDILSTVGGPLGDSYWRPSIVAGTSPVESPAGIAPLPADSAPTGFLSKAEAVIWSGPAIMVFPGDAQEEGGNVAGTLTADTPAADNPADPPAPVTRADLDPVLSAMGLGADHHIPSDSGSHIPSDSGSADLSGAFLPPDGNDPPHFDSGMLFTPPPLPPPPDLI